MSAISTKEPDGLKTDELVERLIRTAGRTKKVYMNAGGQLYEVKFIHETDKVIILSTVGINPHAVIREA